MAHENWQRVKEIFADALRQTPEMRPEFLDRVCSDDKKLRREIESLLTSFDSAESFMETPAVGEMPDDAETGAHRLANGTRFGHYEIIELIGTGGMGEVYLALDTKLDRKVAVKILNEKFSRHESNLNRFMREAKAASSLNHPNILVIHEIGESGDTHYIVSEFVEGETLRDFVRTSCGSGRLNDENQSTPTANDNPPATDLAQILDITIQIANALSVAHEARLIHRDIKPENIMIRPDGLVKVLDFGLAKLIAQKSEGVKFSTVKTNDTAKGVIMGTVNYMSPEQAKGEKVDERTDIFSLGAVLYEMIAGQIPFAGDSMPEIYANLINQEPQPLSSIVSDVPEKLQTIVSKMLCKNKDERYQKMIEAVADLKDLQVRPAVDERLKTSMPLKKQSADNVEMTGEITVATNQSQKKPTNENGFVTDGDLQTHLSSPIKSEKRVWLWAASVFTFIGFVVIGVFLFGFFGTKPDHGLNFEQMKQTRLTQSGDVYAPTISPNGQYLVYIFIAGNQHGLRLRQIATGQVLELLPPRTNTDFWFAGFSKDSNYVFYTEHKENNSGILYRIPSLGGQPQKIVEFVSGGATFSPDGTRLAFVRINKQDGITSIIVANNDGSNEQTIVTTDTDSLFQSLDWSPDGSTIAFAVKRHEPKGSSWYVAEIPADGGTERRIGKVRDSQITNAWWMPDKKGFILSAVDPKTKLPQLYYLSYPDGTESRITNDLNYYLGISVTADGKSIVAQRREQNRTIWILPANGDTRQARQLTFKKDQHFETVSWLTNDTLIFDTDENGAFDNRNIWRLKIGDSEPQSLTTGAGDNTFPVVAPDGQTIAFVSSRSGKSQIWRMNADGSRATQITEFDYNIYAPQFTPDGQTLYFKTSIGGKGRLMRVSINGGEPVSVSKADIHKWAISPDGKKLAYSTIKLNQPKVFVFIRPLEEDRIEKVLDIEPKTYLQWSKDGKALDFTSTADNVKNIWRYNLADGKVRQLTDFDKEEIFRFAASPDGKNLACIRYTTTYDAVMLTFNK